MRVQGAVIREQGQTFAVVVVKPSVALRCGAGGDHCARRSGASYCGIPREPQRRRDFNRFPESAV